jgi:peptidyl-prolyl cis-trans isomerase C
LPTAVDSASVRADPRLIERRFTPLPEGLSSMASRRQITGQINVQVAARTFGALVAAALLCAPLAAVRAQDNPVIARVNGVDLHESDLAFAEEEIGSNMPQIPPEQKRDYLITYLTDVVIVSQAAEKQKLDQRDDVKARLAFDHNRVLMEAMLSDAGKAALTDDAMHKVYDEAVKQVPAEEEVHARHILVATEDEAKAIEDQLKKGADFAALAKEKSKDPGAADGGDLGYFTKDQMVPEFADAAFKLDKGQISDPVHTQFGWHIIQVEDKRTKPTPTFDQVKAQLSNYVEHRAQAELVDNLRKNATIERLDKPAVPPALDPSALNPAAPAKK